MIEAVLDRTFTLFRTSGAGIYHHCWRPNSRIWQNGCDVYHNCHSQGSPREPERLVKVHRVAS